MNINRHIKKKFRVKPKDLVPYTGWLESTRENIYELFAELGYNRGAEIGVDRGGNSKQMFTRIPNLNLTLVDPWRAYGRSHSDRKTQEIFERCQRRLRHWTPRYIRKTSVEASKDVEDNSLDFVYIDGMHTFDNVMLDLIHWVPKVKKNGIISGHDFFYSYSEDHGVVNAINAYTSSHGINDWYITGGVTHCRFVNEPPSWFWVNE